MSNHPVYSDDMREIVESFVVETQEILDELNNDLLSLEQAEDTVPIIDKIFRAVHTVKGTSGFLSLEQLNLLSHNFEDVLNRVRRGKVAFHPGMMDVLFAAFDLMNVLLQQVLDSAIEPVPMEGLLHDLQQLATGGFPQEYVIEGDGWRPGPGQSFSSMPGVSASEQGRARRTVHLQAEDGSEGTSPVEETAVRNRHSDSIRVSVERLDELLSLVGELVLNRNHLIRILNEASGNGIATDCMAELTAASSKIDDTTSRLQSVVFETRMVPVGSVFSRFQRVVRELAKELNKEVELVVEGAETEFDKSIVDEIGDPILHLMRNAVDHGIETPAERKRRGKPACGRLLLRAELDGGHVLIIMEDDGAGIDVGALRRRAVGSGFAGEGELASMENADVVDLIFKPGFSTNDQATRISGRGVGLDIVRTEITRLGGEVRIESEHGRGTRFTLRLPLTLVIMQCLIVEVGDEAYAVPLGRVSEVTSAADVTTVGGRAVVRIYDEAVPVIDVGDTFGLPAQARSAGYIVLVRHDREQFGLIVDRLGGHEEVVVKPLNAHLSSIEGFSGSTILGDGRVVMVLDVEKIIRLELAQRSVGPRRTTPV